MKSLILCTIGLVLLQSVTAQRKSPVKWRRINRPFLSISPDVREEPSSTSRPSITWKRSTISRRSTTQTEPTLPEEEIEVAESKEESVVVDDGQENEPSFKPLVPGSRPGFWLDSSRRKKPEQLLRAGARKRPLFPVKLSTLISQNISESVTANPVIELTSSTVRSTTDLTSSTETKSKLFSLNRSTRPPISFRRKLKTTKAPSTTTESSDFKDILKETKSSANLPLEKIIKKEIEKDEVESSEKEESKTEIESIRKINRIPLPSTRRRIRNGTVTDISNTDDFQRKTKSSVNFLLEKIIKKDIDKDEVESSEKEESETETESLRKINKIPLPSTRRRLRNGTVTDLSNTDDFLRKTKSSADLPSTQTVNLNTENDELQTIDNNNKQKQPDTEIPRNRISLSGIRRRTRNGTRLPWNNESSRLVTKTTKIPKLVSTTAKYSTVNNERYLRKTTSTPKLISRTRTNKTTTPTRVSWTRNQYTTSSPTTSTGKAEKTFVPKLKGPTDYLRNRNTHRFNRLKFNPSIKEDTENDIQNFNSHIDGESIKTVTSAKIADKKTYTTEEPFFVTREYGQVVTASDLDIPKKKIYPISRTTSAPKQTTTVATDLATTDEIVDFTEGLNYTFNDEFENESVEFDDVAETDEFQSLKTDEQLSQHEEKNLFTTPPPQLKIEPTTPETPSKPPTALKTSTTPRPLFSITPPLTPPTIEPGANAYVVWSLGQDGSGWSYQKQGGQVTWSAQNSEVAGDRWSVQGKDEPVNIQSNMNWTPTRNISYHKDQQLQKSLPHNAKTVLPDKWTEEMALTPSIPYLSETPLKIKSTTEDFRLPPLTASQVFPHFQEDPFSIPQNFKPLAVNGSQANKSETNTQDESPGEGLAGTSDELSITSDTGAELNLLGSISQNSSADSPYLIEFRETFATDVPNLNTETSTDFPESFTMNTNFIQNLEEESFYYQPPSPDYQNIQIDDPSAFIDEPTEYNSPMYPGENRQSETDLSGLPPALAKAVVEAKRWTIVGTGDKDGWSLYGEDGKLEWKIHNIDGKWSVTSADEIVNYDDAEPYRNLNPQDIKTNNKNNLENEGANERKVWTMDDDYEKWRLVSAKNAPEENQPQKNVKFNNEYEYPQKEESENDYYDENEDYENEGEESFDGEDKSNVYQNDFEERPLWGENQMIQNIQDHRFPNGVIEEANTEQDAYDAWKSLLSNQGRWNAADSEEILNQDYQSKSLAHIKSFSPNVLQEESDWKVSSGPMTVRNKQREQPDVYSPQVFEPPMKIPNQNSLRNRNEEQHAVANSLRSLDKYREILEHKLNEDNYDRARPYTDYSESREKIEDTAIQNYYGNSAKPSSGDHGKVDKLINKLETLHKEANGKAVVDLSQLLKLIKANRNITSKTQEDSRVNGNQGGPQIEFSNSQKQDEKRIREYVDKLKQNRLKNPPMFTDPLSKLSFDEQTDQSNKQVLSNVYQESQYQNPQDLGNLGHLNDYAEKTQQFKLRIPEPYNYSPSGFSTAEKLRQNDEQVLSGLRQQKQFSNNQQIGEAERLEDYNDKSRHNQKTRSESAHHSSIKLPTDDRTIVDPRFNTHKTHSRLQYDENTENRRHNPKPRRRQQKIKPLIINNDENKRKNENKHLNTFNQVEQQPPNVNVLSQRPTITQIKEKSAVRNVKQQLERRNKRPSNNRFKPTDEPKYRPFSTTPATDEEVFNDSEENIDMHANPIRNPHDYATVKQQLERRNKRPSNNRFKPTDEPRYRPFSTNPAADEEEFNDSEENIDIRAQPEKNHHNYENGPRYNLRSRRPDKRRHRKQHNYSSAPIVLSGETEIEDEDGLKKNRKIIVIDYAGKQKKKSSIDRKDLELIIRNVRNRRSGQTDEFSEENKFEN